MNCQRALSSDQRIRGQVFLIAVDKLGVVSSHVKELLEAGHLRLLGEAVVTNPVASEAPHLQVVDDVAQLVCPVAEAGSREPKKEAVA